MEGDGKHEAHIVSNINAANVLAKFFGVQFKVRDKRDALEKRIMDVLGIVPRHEMEKLTEEIDRLQGKIKALQRSVND